MTTVPNPTTAFHHRITAANHHQFFPKVHATNLHVQETQIPRRKIITTFLTSLALGLQATPLALAQNWGTRSFLRERFFEPGLSPEDAVARIRQTAEGLHDLRGMLETMSWRYVIFYIRLKQAYLSQDMKTALSMVPESRRKSYVQTANELVDNMAEVCYKFSMLLVNIYI